MKLTTSLGLLTALAVTLAAHGQRNKLQVGDAAPGIDVDQWVKGEATTIESGKVYVVEFWATWCAPCRKSIPHLTELQETYSDQGLTIIGVSDEEADVVRPFVTGQADQMKYTVAVDRRSATKRAWMNAAGLQGIPAAFIVDRSGKIAFIGHPLDDEFQMTLERVLQGRFDPKLEKEAEPMLKAARSARKMRNWRMARHHYDEVIALNPTVFAEIALEQFGMLLVDMNDPTEAYAYARSKLMGEYFTDDAQAMAMLARKIVSEPNIEPSARNMDLALEAAQAARQLAGASDPSILATMAMVQFNQGQIAEAVETQKRAYFVASPKHKAEYRRALKSYQEALEDAR